MDRVRFVALLVLLALLLSVRGVASAVGVVGVPPADGSVSARHLLLQAQDVAEFGTTHVLVPDNPLKKIGQSNPGVLDGWEEARVTSFLLDIENAKQSVVIGSSSYRFASPKSAQAALQAVLDPTWMVLRSKGASLLGDALVRSLSSHSAVWNAWQGIDKEGLLTYVLMIQSGPYVSEVQMAIGPDQEPFAQRLLTAIAEKIHSGKVGASGFGNF